MIVGLGFQQFDDGLDVLTEFFHGIGKLRLYQKIPEGNGQGAVSHQLGIGQTEDFCYVAAMGKLGGKMSLELRCFLPKDRMPDAFGDVLVHTLRHGIAGGDGTQHDEAVLCLGEGEVGVQEILHIVDAENLYQRAAEGKIVEVFILQCIDRRLIPDEDIYHGLFCIHDGLRHEGGLLLRDEEGAAIDIVADARAVVGLDFSRHIDGHPLFDGFHQLFDIAADGVDNLDFPSLGDDGGEQL